MRWTSRATVLMAAITAICSVGALFVGVRAATADIGAQLSYDCTTASGTRKVAVRVTADMPTAGAVGKPIRLGRVRLTLGLPADAAGLAGSGGALPDVLGGSVRLAVTVSQKGETVDAGWPPFTVTSSVIAGGGKVRLVADGPVPSLSPRSSGEVIWRSGALGLTLTRGSGGPPVVIRCAPQRDRVLGRVAVGSAASGGQGNGRSGSGGVRPAAEDPYFPKCKALPPGVLPDGTPNPEGGLNPDPRLAPDPPLFNAELSPPQAGIASCSRMAGFANIAKLGSAIPVASESLIRRGYRSARAFANGENYQYQQVYAVAQATPATATSLGFGFLPTTATAQVEQVATVPGANNFANATAQFESGIDLPVAFKPQAVGRAFVVVRVIRAEVNGVPIDLGAAAPQRCRTPPAKLKLVAPLASTENGGVTFFDGGTYSGTINVPPFRPGCGAGEDLSPLLTASTAGKGNFTRLEFGPLCGVEVPGACDSQREPLTYTIKPGGEATLEAKPFVINSPQSPVPGAEIRCASATMKAKLRKGHWLGQTGIGRITAGKFTDCRLQPDNIRQTLTFEQLPVPLHQGGAGDAVETTAAGIYINARGSDGCVVRFGMLSYNQNGEPIAMKGSMIGPYDSKAGTWTIREDATIVPTMGTQCSHDIPGFFIAPDVPWFGTTITAAFKTTPKQTITTR